MRNLLASTITVVLLSGQQSFPLLMAADLPIHQIRSAEFVLAQVDTEPDEDQAIVDDQQARELLNQLLQVAEQIPPIEIDFICNGITDAETDAKILKSLNEKHEQHGKKVVESDTTSPLHATWVLYGQSESVAARAGTKRDELYLATTVGTLERVAEGKYNIQKALTGGPIRPFHFYIDTIGKPWGKLREAMSVSFAVDDSSVGGQASENIRVLDIQLNETSAARLDVQLEPLRVKRFQGFYAGQKFAEVIVHSFATDSSNSARHFPIEATRIMYTGNREIRRDELVCQKIKFHDASLFDSAMLDVMLPKGAEVYDAILERTIDLSSPTSGIKLLTATDGAGLSNDWIDIPREKPVGGRLSDIADLRRDSKGILFILIPLNIVVIIFVYLYFRKNH